MLGTPADSTDGLAKERFCFMSLLLTYWNICLKGTRKYARKTECEALTGENENPVSQEGLPLVLCGGGKTKSLC